MEKGEVVLVWAKGFTISKQVLHATHATKQVFLPLNLISGTHSLKDREEQNSIMLFLFAAQQQQCPVFGRIEQEFSQTPMKKVPRVHEKKKSTIWSKKPYSDGSTYTRRGLQLC